MARWAGASALTGCQHQDGSGRRRQRAALLSISSKRVRVAHGGPAGHAQWEDPYYLRSLPHGVRIKYDANGRYIGTINRLGHETIFDGSARLWKITVPPSTAPLSYVFSYTATENLVAAPGSRGVTVTLTSGRLTMIEDPDNRNVQFGYDASFANRMTSRTDRRTTVTSYQYGWGSRLKEASTAMGSGQASIVTKFTALESKGFVGSSSPASVDTTIAYTRCSTAPGRTWETRRASGSIATALPATLWTPSATAQY